jgi:aromatic-L-amino-acid decarboxylase
VTPEEFRAAAHVLVDWIADHRARLADLPVRASVAPGEVAAALPHRAPGAPEPLSALLDDLERVIVPGLTHPQHPRFAAWFPANASLSSVLGDMASSGLGVIGISWESAPALTELEEVVVDWLRELAGLSDDWRGVIQDTASTACLVAMIAARERACGACARGAGLQGAPAPLTVYVSEQAHSSVEKAVVLAGYGRDNLRTVPVDPRTRAMRPDALAEAMDADRAAGRRPAAVVATVGTTNTTAIDPLADILPVAAAHGAWVHVDAAMAGSALLLPECRWMVAGIDGAEGVPGADSLSWNPHKWMGTVLDCSLMYVRDPAALTAVMGSTAAYLRSGSDGAVTQYRDWGVPLGRRFRALKPWFQLRLDGPEAIRARLRRDLASARELDGLVRARPGWRVLAPVVLQTVCVRHEPPGLEGDDLDRHTLAWVAAVNDTGGAYLTPSQLDGRWMVRVSIGAEATGREDVLAIWRLMHEAAEAA